MLPWTGIVQPGTLLKSLGLTISLQLPRLWNFGTIIMACESSSWLISIFLTTSLVIAADRGNTALSASASWYYLAISIAVDAQLLHILVRHSLCLFESVADLFRLASDRKTIGEATLWAILQLDVQVSGYSSWIPFRISLDFGTCRWISAEPMSLALGESRPC